MRARLVRRAHSLSDNVRRPRAALEKSRFALAQQHNTAGLCTGGSTKNGRDSNAQRRGVKVYGGQRIKAGGIIVRQLGTVVRRRFFACSSKALRSRFLCDRGMNLKGSNTVAPATSTFIHSCIWLFFGCGRVSHCLLEAPQVRLRLAHKPCCS